jgi:hypothetical protein
LCSSSSQHTLWSQAWYYLVQQWYLWMRALCQCGSWGTIVCCRAGLGSLLQQVVT